MIIDFLILFIVSKFFIKGDSRKGYITSVGFGILMIIHLLIYMALVELIKINYAPFKGFVDFQPKYPWQIDYLKYVLLGVAVAEFGFIYFIRKIIVKKLQEVDLRREQIVLWLLILSFLICALCECIAIYGQILFLLTGNRLNFYIFLILCLVCLGIYFPRYGQWEKWAKLQ